MVGLFIMLIAHEFKKTPGDSEDTNTFVSMELQRVGQDLAK